MEQATNTSINNTENTKRIHPLMAGAACSVILVSLLGAAAITGLLPSSRGNVAATPSVDTAASLANQNLAFPAAKTGQADAGYNIAAQTGNLGQPQQNMQPLQQVQQQIAQPVQQAAPKYVQASTYHQPAHATRTRYEEPARAYHREPQVAQNSPVGIGVGAVIGGLLGNQVGNGNGRTLATIAGVVGGGYLGNEVAKRNQQANGQ